MKFKERLKGKKRSWNTTRKLKAPERTPEVTSTNFKLQILILKKNIKASKFPISITLTNLLRKNYLSPSIPPKSPQTITKQPKTQTFGMRKEIFDGLKL